MVFELDAPGIGIRLVFEIDPNTAIPHWDKYKPEPTGGVDAERGLKAQFGRTAKELAGRVIGVDVKKAAGAEITDKPCTPKLKLTNTTGKKTASGDSAPLSNLAVKFPSIGTGNDMYCIGN